MRLTESSAPSAIKTAWGTAVLVMLCALRVAAAEPHVVAVVNGAPITDTMVNQVVKSLIVARGSTPSSDEIAQLSDAALASLIDLELLYGAAQQQQIRINDADVQAEIARSKARVGGDQAFAAALQRSGMSQAQLEAETRKTLMVDRFVEQQLMKDVRISPEAARRFYDENPQEFRRGDKVMPFEQVRPSVEKALRESERRQRQEAYLVVLRKAARIERPTPKP
jgi:hypothetical protein